MKNCYYKLEYDKILIKLASYCKTYVGQDLANKLLPSNSEQEVIRNLKQTTQALSLIHRIGNLPVDTLPNIDVSIKYLESNNSLSAKSLLDIGKVLRLSHLIKDYFISSTNINIEDFNLISDYFNNLYTNIQIEDRIFRCIEDENTIADNASSTLSSLRRNRRKLEQEVKDKLNSMIHSSSYSKYIMEPIVTIKNDRYVIPVKVEYKENIKGFIHDISASGSTVFMEPLTIFELNTKIANIKIEENIEIEKILRDISLSLAPLSQNIQNNISLIGLLDFIFAKAQYSIDIDGIEPQINNEKFFKLLKARHPLLDKDIAVPIDITLGLDYTSLIITGPNTGGKTVTLKTVGLLSLMAQSGLHIPANEESSIHIFESIFASIGDEQSIQESLSTFSSHMLNIIDILDSFNENSLILLDELGSGTDPIEGEALAISILEKFHKKNTLTLATTHYPGIKNFAQITNGFENASCEFDIENLKPTYKLLIGVPGKSNAFAISKRLGLSDEILDRANELLTDDHISIEELLKSIYDDKIKHEKEKEEIEQNLNQVTLLRKSLESDLSSHKQSEKEIIENAKEKARSILLEAKKEANEIIKDLNELPESSCSLKDANNIRNRLNLSIKNYSPMVNTSISGTLEKSDVQIGMTVLVKNLNTKGTILSLPNRNGDIQVQIGNAKMMVNIANLEKAR